MFTIHGSSSQDANAATFPVKPGRPFSHSSTVTFGFGYAIVAVDPRIGKAGQNLVVAGVGKPHPVGHPRVAAFRGVTEDLTILCDHGPDIGQQFRATFLRCGASKSLFDFLLRRIRDASFFRRQQVRASFRRRLLPSHAVHGYDE